MKIFVDLKVIIFIFKTMKYKDIKRKPEKFMPHGVELLRVSSYASKLGITTARVYQLFKEDKLDLVTIDGAIFVRLSDAV